MEEEDAVNFDLDWYSLEEKLVLDGKDIDTGKGKSFLCGLKASGRHMYVIRLKVKVEASELAQVPISIFVNGTLQGMFTLNNTNGEYVEVEQVSGAITNAHNYLKLFFAEGGAQIDSIEIERVEKKEDN